MRPARPLWAAGGARQGGFPAGGSGSGGAWQEVGNRIQTAGPNRDTKRVVSGPVDSESSCASSHTPPTAAARRGKPPLYCSSSKKRSTCSHFIQGIFSKMVHGSVDLNTPVGSPDFQYKSSTAAGRQRDPLPTQGKTSGRAS